MRKRGESLLVLEVVGEVLLGALLSLALIYSARQAANLESPTKIMLARNTAFLIDSMQTIQGNAAVLLNVTEGFNIAIKPTRDGLGEVISYKLRADEIGNKKHTFMWPANLNLQEFKFNESFYIYKNGDEIGFSKEHPEYLMKYNCRNIKLEEKIFVFETHNHINEIIQDYTVPEEDLRELGLRIVENLEILDFTENIYVNPISGTDFDPVNEEFYVILFTSKKSDKNENQIKIYYDFQDSYEIACNLINPLLGEEEEILKIINGTALIPTKHNIIEDLNYNVNPRRGSDPKVVLVEIIYSENLPSFSEKTLKISKGFETGIRSLVR